MERLSVVSSVWVINEMQDNLMEIFSGGQSLMGLGMHSMKPSVLRVTEMDVTPKIDTNKQS